MNNAYYLRKISENVQLLTDTVEDTGTGPHTVDGTVDVVNNVEVTVTNTSLPVTNTGLTSLHNSIASNKVNVNISSTSDNVPVSGTVGVSGTVAVSNASMDDVKDILEGDILNDLTSIDVHLGVLDGCATSNKLNVNVASTAIDFPVNIVNAETELDVIVTNEPFVNVAGGTVGVTNDGLTAIQNAISSNKVNVNISSTTDDITITNADITDQLTLLQDAYKIQFRISTIPTFTLSLSYLLGGRVMSVNSTSNYVPPWLDDVSFAFDITNTTAIQSWGLYVMHENTDDDDMLITLTYYDASKILQSVTINTSATGSWFLLANSVALIENFKLSRAPSGTIRIGVDTFNSGLGSDCFMAMINETQTYIGPNMCQGIPPGSKYRLGKFTFCATGDNCYFRVWKVRQNSSTHAKEYLLLFETIGFNNVFTTIDLSYLGWFDSTADNVNWKEIVSLSTITVGVVTPSINTLHLELQIIW